MNEVAEKEDFQTIFVKRLYKLDSGERARFKRNAGIAINESHNAMGLFYKKLLYDLRLYNDQENVYFLVATLFAFEKKPKKSKEDAGKEPQKRPDNFGKSLSKIRWQNSAKGLDRRFERLLDADGQQLLFYMHREVKFLFNNGGSVDWVKLLKDLLNWDHPARYVQRNWARAYFATPTQEEENRR